MCGIIESLHVTKEVARMRGTKGFTLREMMIVIVVIAILLGVLLP